MASFNKVVLMGNITRNPDVRSIPGSGTSVAHTGIAVSRRSKDRDEVMFIDLVAFGRNAEVMGEYIVKGSPILVEGRLSMNVWKQEDGSQRTKHEVIIDTFQMIGSRRDRGADSNITESNGNTPSEDKSSNQMMEDDDIPF